MAKMTKENLTKNDLTKDNLIDLYRVMLKIRLFEEKIVDLYPEQEMKCPVHLCIGQEAIAAGVSAHLNKDDYIFSNHRGHGHAIAKGANMSLLMAEFYGKETGCSGGKGGSMHIIETERGIMGTSAIVGGGIPMGVGAALASSIKKDGKVTVIYNGDGASEEGVFYESLNFASLKKLPVVFVCENNGYATNSPQIARHSSCEIARLGPALGAASACIDGNDVLAVYDTAKEAIERARNGGGPTLIEASTYRWKGHVGPGEDHLIGSRPEDELVEWKELCPIVAFDKKLTTDGAATEAELIELGSVLAEEIAEAVRFAKDSEYPDVDKLLTNIYYESKE